MFRTRKALFETLHRHGGVLAAALLFTTTASAGNLAVNGAAQHDGSYGLELTVGSSCFSGTYLVLDNVGVITTDREGCETILAQNNTSVSGTVEFKAGSSIAFGNGFEVTAGSNFTAAIDENLSPFAWVQDDSPADEVNYNAEFFIDADSLSLASADEIHHLVAYSGNQPAMRVSLQPGSQLALEVIDDLGTWHTSSLVSLSNGWNLVSLSWEAGISATASLSVNGGTAVGLTGLSTASIRISSVRWGAVGGTADSTSGSLYQDDFNSWR
jgi:hypothetical protein